MSTQTELTHRIRQIRDVLCNGDNTEFARRLGRTRQQASALCSGSANAGLQMLDLILRSFPSVSREWLISGTGAMLTSGDELPHSTPADICSDIADTLSRLSAHFYRLASCLKPSAS